MEKFKKILILSIKILFTIMLSFFFTLVIIFSGYCMSLDFQQMRYAIKGIFLFLLVSNIFLISYINWAIWTKGKLKKIFMATVVLFVLFIYGMILIIE